MATKRSQRVYDHRLVQETGDGDIATRLGVPRSTVAGWLRRAPRPVTAAAGEDEAVAVLRVRVARLEHRCRRLSAILRVLFVLLRTLKPDLSRRRARRQSGVRLIPANVR